MQKPRISYLNYEEIRYIHLEVVGVFFSAFRHETTRYGILNDHGIRAAIDRPKAGTADGREFFPTVPLKAAALIHSIIKGHPFIDANKRTGILSGWVFMSLNGVVARLDQDQLYQLALDVESDRLDVTALGSILHAFFTDDKPPGQTLYDLLS